MSEVKELFKRIKKSPEGSEFIEYLLELSNDNYEAWKRDKAEHDGIHKGYALAIDNLLKVFSECDTEVVKVPEVNAWS